MWTESKASKILCFFFSCCFAFLLMGAALRPFLFRTYFQFKIFSPAVWAFLFSRQFQIWGGGGCCLWEYCCSFLLLLFSVVGNSIDARTSTDCTTINTAFASAALLLCDGSSRHWLSRRERLNACYHNYCPFSQTQVLRLPKTFWDCAVSTTICMYVLGSSTYVGMYV